MMPRSVAVPVPVSAISARGGAGPTVTVHVSATVTSFSWTSYDTQSSESESSGLASASDDLMPVIRLATVTASGNQAGSLIFLTLSRQMHTNSFSTTGVRTIVSPASMTPAAARVLARKEFHKSLKTSALHPGDRKQDLSGVPPTQTSRRVTSRLGIIAGINERPARPA